MPPGRFHDPGWPVTLNVIASYGPPEGPVWALSLSVPSAPEFCPLAGVGEGSDGRGFGGSVSVVLLLFMVAKATALSSSFRLKNQSQVSWATSATGWSFRASMVSGTRSPSRKACKRTRGSISLSPQLIETYNWQMILQTPPLNDLTSGLE